jgi:hypothetical protein
METSFPFVRDVLLFAIAIYGAALSTFNWRQSVRKDRRQITVSFSTAMPVWGNQLGAPYLKLEAFNTGQRVVTVKTLTLETPSGDRIAPMVGDRLLGMPDTRLPVSLSDGQAAHLSLPYSDVADGPRPKPENQADACLCRFGRQRVPRRAVGC